MGVEAGKYCQDLRVQTGSGPSSKVSANRLSPALRPGR